MIDIFKGQYEFLSNFYVEENGKSVEHFFQAQKSTNTKDFLWVFSSETPSIAKKRGRQIQIKPNWDSIKLDVMRNLLEIKFEDPELKQKLLNTGEEELIEGNWWGDVYWGVCNGVGENHLGKLLMEIRTSIREEILDVASESVSS